MWRACGKESEMELTQEEVNVMGLMDEAARDLIKAMDKDDLRATLAASDRYREIRTKHRDTLWSIINKIMMGVNVREEAAKVSEIWGEVTAAVHDNGLTKQELAVVETEEQRQDRIWQAVQDMAKGE
jgi:hypothetical protein